MTAISTAALTGYGPTAIRTLQKEMALAQTELTTGRKADLGEQLGYQTGAVISLTAEQSRIEAQINSNAVVSTKLDASQAAMTSVSQAAQTFLSALVTASQSGASASAAGDAARNGLEVSTSALNTSVSGVYIFAGLNTSTAPMTDYYSSPQSKARAAMIGAFTQEFGFPPTDPAASNISASAMQGFIDSRLSQVFADPNWGANWSSASISNATARVSESETVSNPANLNAAPFRQITQAYAMIAEFAGAKLNPAAQSALVGSAIKLTSTAAQGLTAFQASVGDAQNRISASDDQMKLQSNILATQVDALTGVDAAAAAERVATLTTQIEAAYSMTAQIEKLSLANNI